MRRRYQVGSLTNVDGRWKAQWWDNGQRRKRTLGLVSNTPKSEAKVQLVAILSPINARYAGPSVQTALGDFLKNVYLPFYRRKWKSSTYMTNAERLKVHMLADLGATPLGEFTRDGLQDYLDRKAAAGLSNSMVSHMRWDLRQILRLAVADGHIMKNPAEELFVPRSAARAVRKVMSMKKVNDCIGSLERRESLIAKLALLVDGIGIVNIVLVSVTERTPEIGMRLAVSAKTRDILPQFLVEAVTLSLLGWMIGIAVGLTASVLISRFANWSTEVSVLSVRLAFLFSALVGVFFVYYPARKVAFLDPIEALRYE